MTRSGQEYLESLRDGREVWLDGERVKDVTRHAAFRNTAASIARLYDLAHSSGHRARLTSDGEHRAFAVPRSYEDLVARREAYKVWAEASFGFLGRTPDYMAGGAAGFAAAPAVFTTDSFDGADNALAYWRRLAEGDLYATFTLANPQIDRTRPASEQEEDDLVVRAVAEKDGGVVVRGAKMIGTASVFGNEVVVGTIEPLAPQDVEHALCFSLPLDTPGLKLLSRTSYEAQARSVYDNPLSSRFDENDALLVCDDVFVPWERMLTYRNVDTTFRMWWRTPAYVNFVHQAATRFWTKLEFLTGIAILLTKANNTHRLPQVTQAVGRLMGKVAQAKAFVLAAEASYEQVDGGDGAAVGAGGVMPGKEISFAQRIMAGELYPQAVQEIRMLAGGGLIQLPASGEDLLHPELGPLVRKYIRSPGHPAEDRVKLLKLAWDALGSEFAGRHEQYERFYHGAPHVYLMQQAWEGDTAACEELARSCLDGYGLTGRAAGEDAAR
ncbi:4-hydroxyphenylacetate 3-hydroxylase N-terminal domain-containing protein [Streptomyces sp. HNM0663]|uniref:4-hydroxyphenylacetate 3-hydroxylase N-terminal domain-containing protein n=1 Tax=Streptomyces chengmaiensis TaxID=3040919 RepID=A0ABT6HG02_9ACTN|nr:4-hydroxyphenylacetate 3-hydroxylase N-terminal domain-containing protein [Streptomyces chengmaiensis]MDH2387256.1 4-hydroxyphenylacetate 3-hydroxylase N-terminal domain-containing protein [Streptomyces chengmaiensis]